jgi:predicted component of type VI protein secretion system
MRDRPSAADLIEIAREVLQQELLPRLPPGLRIHGLMVANALANAEREISAGSAPLLAELGRLVSRYGEGIDASGGEPLQGALERLNRRLVADIRAGRLDGNQEIARHLLATAVDAVRESNPKYLRSRGIE